MSQLSRDQLGDAFNVLTDRVKEGMMAPLYQRMSEGYEKELARDKAKEAMKPGNLAPESVSYTHLDVYKRQGSGMSVEYSGKDSGG